VLVVWMDGMISINLVENKDHAALLRIYLSLILTTFPTRNSRPLLIITTKISPKSCQM